MKSFKLVFWGAVGGSVVTMIIGFTWGGWTSGGTAEKMAQQRAEAAVVAALTPICMQNFTQQRDVAKKLEELRAADSWKQREFVETGGWATMPGSKEPSLGVAGACAEALLKTGSKT